MTNQIAEFKTKLVKHQEVFMPMVGGALTNNGIEMDQYQKTCVMNAITSINTVLENNGLDFGSPNLDRNNLTDVLFKVAALKLNATATPREVYFSIRSVKRGNEWMKQVEMGIEGDGNDALAANFGRDVKTIHQHWLVREDDDFKYPKFKGIEIEPPEWTPKGKGKVIRVVYPITKTDGSVEYLIAERDDVVRNLIAHVKQNLMKSDMKKEEKDSLFAEMEDLGLDECLNNPKISQHVSPAWKDPQSKEAMIIRKMRNNVVKKIPKDFGIAYLGLAPKEETEEAKVMKVINDENASTFVNLDEKVDFVEAELVGEDDGPEF